MSRFHFFLVVFGFFFPLYLIAQPCQNLFAISQEMGCLLKPVQRYGHLGAALSEMPSPLNELVGKPMRISKIAFRRYLNQRGIQDTQLGGSLDAPLSRTLRGESAKYFVIHDTSTPLPRFMSFPNTINTSAWSGNNLANYGNSAHVFINRLGESVTKVPFERGKGSTKYEVYYHPQLIGLFLHIELVQPRRVNHRGSDAEAPEQGFTDWQLDRLALAYIAASLRKGTWLFPTYHAVVDAGLKNAHDDPQNFDLSLWANRLKRIILDIETDSGTR